MFILNELDIEMRGKWGIKSVYFYHSHLILQTGIQIQMENTNMDLKLDAVQRQQC